MDYKKKYLKYKLKYLNAKQKGGANPNDLTMEDIEEIEKILENEEEIDKLKKDLGGEILKDLYFEEWGKLNSAQLQEQIEELEGERRENSQRIHFWLVRRSEHLREAQQREAQQRLAPRQFGVRLVNGEELPGLGEEPREGEENSRL